MGVEALRSEGGRSEGLVLRRDKREREEKRKRKEEEEGRGRETNEQTVPV